MARMTIAEVTAEVLRKWCGSDAERKPPIPPAQASASAPLPRAGAGLRRDLGPGAKPADRIDPGSGAAFASSRHDRLDCRSGRRAPRRPVTDGTFERPRFTLARQTERPAAGVRRYGRLGTRISGPRPCARRSARVRSCRVSG